MQVSYKDLRLKVSKHAWTSFVMYSLVYLFSEPCGNKLQVTKIQTLTIQEITRETWQYVFFFITKISDLVAHARYQSTR